MHPAKSIAAALFAAIALTPSITAQNEKPAAGGSVRVTPAEATLPVGQVLQLAAEILDPGGRPVEGRVLFLSRARRALRCSRQGELTAVTPGKHEVLVRAMVGGQRGPEAVVVVTVPHPKPAAIQFEDAPSKIYSGTSVRIRAEVVDKEGVARDDLQLTYRSSAPDCVRVDAFGFVHAVAAGEAAVAVEGGGLTSILALKVLDNPVQSLAVTSSHQTARTGDVVTFGAALTDVDGQAVEAPVSFSMRAMPDDTLGNAATGQITEDGRFVAEKPGMYAITASVGAAFILRFSTLHLPYTAQGRPSE